MFIWKQQVNHTISLDWLLLAGFSLKILLNHNNIAKWWDFGGWLPEKTYHTTTIWFYEFVNDHSTVTISIQKMIYLYIKTSYIVPKKTWRLVASCGKVLQLLQFWIFRMLLHFNYDLSTRVYCNTYLYVLYCSYTIYNSS